MRAKEAADLWGYTQATISKWRRDGLIEGSEQEAHGSPWHIQKMLNVRKQ